MSSSINASLTAGLIQTADTSGILNLQSNGTTKVAVSSSGVDLTGLSKSSLPTGSVLQVVYGTGVGAITTSSSTFVDTTKNTLAITTISATSKILCLLTFGPSPAAASDGQVVLRSSIDSYVSNLTTTRSYMGTNGANGSFASSISYLHTHGQAAGTAITYKTYYNCLAGNFALADYWSVTGLTGTTYTTTLMEIAA